MTLEDHIHLVLEVIDLRHALQGVVSLRTKLIDSVIDLVAVRDKTALLGVGPTHVLQLGHSQDLLVDRLTNGLVRDDHVAGGCRNCCVALLPRLLGKRLLLVHKATLLRVLLVGCIAVEDGPRVLWHWILLEGLLHESGRAVNIDGLGIVLRIYVKRRWGRNLS